MKIVHYIDVISNAPDSQYCRKIDFLSIRVSVCVKN